MQWKDFKSLMKRLMFYCLIALFVVIDSFLLSSPNLLGKIGLFIYKYSYLRTFPRTLLTVSIAVLVIVIIGELILILVRKGIVKKKSGRIIFGLLILISVGALIKTALDFSTWTYGHTGARFRYGAYLLPLLWITTSIYHLIFLPKANSQKPMPAIDETNVQQ
jgi:hypothetical protein